MEALAAVAIMLMIVGITILGFIYMELKRFVDQICKPMPKMPQMAYGPPMPPRTAGKAPDNLDEEPLGFRPHPKKKKEKTDED